MLQSVVRRLPADAGARRVVEVSRRVDEGALRALLRHECCAVVVRGFVGASTVARAVAEVTGAAERGEAANWLISQREGELVDSDVETLGVPLNVARARGPDAVDRYYRDALVRGGRRCLARATDAARRPRRGASATTSAASARPSTSCGWSWTRRTRSGACWAATSARGARTRPASCASCGAPRRAGSCTWTTWTC